ncbi:methylated-DNA--[protein]-cysteine S-methyltransferase [Gallaecimonas sp. GXIMD4217]|uniref:methylated-DNA--[protein]-cysteine S-methyltransferase n=1 Tax=Gallaecimonas sp. GXIMD4217 TaxID=3131927 RepID=UPI00311ACEA7
MRKSADSLTKLSAWVETPAGPVAMRELAGQVSEILLLPEPETVQWTPLGRRFEAQLVRYLQSGRADFELPLLAQGTAFQQRVWARLAELPRGETVSYGELARELGTVARALGQACRHNPHPIVVPCHLVLSASGMGGFSGQTGGAMLDFKQWLLNHEGAGRD